MKFIKLLSAILIIISIIYINGCSKSSDLVSAAENKYTAIAGPLDPFEQNKKLGRGINIGNALEANKEGDDGVTIKEEYFQILKQKGFNSVRIPIKWSAHTLATAPFTIDQAFFNRIDQVVDQALSNGLAIIINIHNYTEIMNDPAAEKEKFLAIWKQVSERYQKYPAELFFEPLNEPSNKLTDAIWNQYIKEVLPVIREKNPYRTLILGPGSWSNIANLNSISIPADEKNVIVTFHYYNPFNFTHQGASWVDGSNAWLGTKWSASAAEVAAMRSEMDNAQKWVTANKRPLNMGEFGSYNKADINSRALWTEWVSYLAIERGFSFNYWEFCSGFGIYDPVNKIWTASLLNALIPK